MQEVTWPRELYLNVLGCKALVPDSSTTNDGAPTATASVTTDGDTGDNNSTAAAPPAVVGTNGTDPNPDTDLPPGGALGAAGDALAGAGTAENGGGGGGDGGESTETGEGADGVDDAASSVGGDAAELVEDENELLAGISSSAEGGEQQEEIKGDCFVRIHNATTGRDLQVTRGPAIDRVPPRTLLYT